jgi:2-polyprenyl-3-methyl-5-hydroxy-6-metoxy-1,4-benzoquinol methylase
VSSYQRQDAAMRDWREHWREVAPKSSGSVDECMRQVGKTVMGEPVPLEQVDMIVATITQNLQLVPVDVVLDLGCGNGILTAQIAGRVNQVAGIDVSESLIATARSVNPRDNCEYHVGDLAGLGALPIDNVNKAFSYEVFQHLSETDVQLLLQGLLEQFRSGLVFFVGSLPERSRLRAFYDTPERWAYYEKNVAAGTEQIGHWWEREELVELCDTLGLSCTPSDQTGSLYTSHYRFDAMILLQ